MKNSKIKIKGFSKNRDQIEKNNNKKSKLTEVSINKAFEFIKKGEVKKAEIIYRKLITSGVKDCRIYTNLASICAARNEILEMISLLKIAIDLDPDYPLAYFNLGIALKKKGDLNSSIKAFQKAIDLNPNFSEAFNSLGNVFKEKDDLDSAIYQYQKALKLNPRYVDAYYNLGNILIIKGHLNSAITLLKESIKLQPNHIDSHWDLALAQLLSGNYKDGLINYEWRWKINKGNKFHADPKIKLYKGKITEIKDSLLVVSEQGLGDSMQYMRYIPYLKSQGINISFCVQEKLHNLIKVSGIHSNPLKFDEVKSVEKGHWLPLLSLPKLLQINPENPLVSNPYIFTTDELIIKWKNILASEKKPIVGINWQGNPNVERDILNGRSLPLETFSLIACNHDIRLLSLQKGFGSEQLDTCSFKDNFVKSQNEINKIWDFLEMAAIIANCDLVITSDTAVAHLAGGMGKKTWLLLQCVPEWRWGMKGDKTFWYSSTRLFRQKERYNWHQVIERVDKELHNEFVTI